MLLAGLKQSLSGLFCVFASDYTKLVAAEMECTSNVGLLCDGKHTGVKHTITTIAMIIAKAIIKETK